MTKTLALLAALGLVASPAFAYEPAKTDAAKTEATTTTTTDEAKKEETTKEMAPAAGKTVKKDETKTEEKK